MTSHCVLACVSYSDLGDLDGLLEDGWAVLLKHKNEPASAASLNVFANDHARIQVH